MTKAIDAKQFGKVAVLMGGLHAEREVSLMSGKRVLQGLLNKGINAVGIDVDCNILQVLQDGAFDRVFIVLHGTDGEDGTMQGALELLGLPYTGSGVASSALGMDKIRCKRLWQNHGLPTLPFLEITAATQLNTITSTLGLPVVIKPSEQGSSIGVTIVKNLNDIMEAYQKAAEYGSVLAETYANNGEYTVSILGDRALPIIHIEAQGGFYDYHAKYFSDDTRYLIPCGLPAAQEKELQTLALQAFRALGCSGWGRVDLLRDQQDKFWLLEVNTVPGMTEHSLVPQAARAAGISFDDLVLEILSQTLD